MANFTGHPMGVEGTLTDFADLWGRKVVTVMIVFATLQGLVFLLLLASLIAFIRRHKIMRQQGYLALEGVVRRGGAGQGGVQCGAGVKIAAVDRGSAGDTWRVLCCLIAAATSGIPEPLSFAWRDPEAPDDPPLPPSSRHPYYPDQTQNSDATLPQWKPKMPRWLSAPPLGQHNRPSVWRRYPLPLPWAEMDQVDYIPEPEIEGNYTHFKQPQEDDVLDI
ncbi:hypothetical protein O3P69_010493 [Scylla paramamosain]|uniref:Uncharacterized protein n=1 Tax=Scylla paramamosain TaxID=85552 RepID=A0AAW0TVX6_SCYPA